MFSSLPASVQDIFIQCSNHTIKKKHITTSEIKCELMSFKEILENCSFIILGVLIVIAINLLCLVLLVGLMPVFRWIYRKLRLNQENDASQESSTIFNGLEKFSLYYMKLNNLFNFTK